MAARKSANRLMKERQVAELSKEIKKYNVAALFTLVSLPNKFLQKAKMRLRGQAEFRIVKNSVLKRALEKAGLSPEFVAKADGGQHGLILTNLDPFKLFKELKKGKGRAYAKVGQVAPFDIVVPAGETPFPAGPALSEFKQAGLDVKVVGGKIHISKDKVMAKKGEPISDNAAKILQKLDIRPFEVGVEVEYALRGGLIYDRSILNVDEKEYIDSLITAFSNARLLSVEVAYITKDNAVLLLSKAHANARSLALSQGIPEKEVVGLILTKAQAQAGALEKLVGG
ncbi:MAG: 50S ribosomal protein L10 [Candidatus Micrarchaeia archaeon]